MKGVFGIKYVKLQELKEHCSNVELPVAQTAVGEAVLFLDGLEGLVVRGRWHGRIRRFPTAASWWPKTGRLFAVWRPPGWPDPCFYLVADGIRLYDVPMDAFTLNEAKSGSGGNTEKGGRAFVGV